MIDPCSQTEHSWLLLGLDGTAISGEAQASDISPCCSCRADPRCTFGDDLDLIEYPLRFFRQSGIFFPAITAACRGLSRSTRSLTQA